MQARPVLMLTHDEHLWRHWRQVPSSDWLPAWGQSCKDVSRWRERGQRLVVVDTGLPGLPAPDTEKWQAAVRDLDLLMASLKHSDEQGRQLLVGGAKGYVHAYMPPEALAVALKAVASGGVWLGPTLLARLLQQVDRGASANGEPASVWMTGLTPREIEVAERAARGMSNQAIADELGITERTVRAHVSAVFEKLGVSDRLMLALKVHGISS